MPAPRGTVALAFSDIQGSTTHWERLGAKFSGALARHNELMRAALASWDGHEVKTEGDSFMVAFSSAVNAARFALAAQEALAREPWPADVGDVRVRIGIHVGDPLVVEDASGRVDYLGPVVNRAARISQAAHGGQILISEAARAAAAGGLTGASLVDLGEHRLRGLERPERLWQVLPRSLETRRFPPPATLTGAATNLPAPANSFVGREREVRDVAALLEKGRLVTLTGPGGTGKTRLALRIGAEVLDRFPAGVWFVDLTEARDAAGVSQAVAAVLDAPVTGSSSPEAFVGDLLEFRGNLLLILDNFEQVAEAAPATVGAWLRRAPKLRLLVTSRFLLNVAGEREIALESLPSPAKPGVVPTVAEVAAHDATRLFLERAVEADPAFTLTPQNAPDVAALCAELEGMPLALELAAARIRVLTPAQIVARLADRFKILTSSRRDQTARQRSLAGAIEWSWGLLEEWERSAFAQLCTFRGGFDLEAAEAVLDLSAFAEAPPAIDAVQRLREKSFVRRAESPLGPRFHLYVALREFGATWWRDHASAGEKRALDGQFTGHFIDFAEKWKSVIPTPRAVEALDRLAAERDNFIEAEDRLAAAGASVLRARLTLGTAELFATRGPWKGRAARLEAILAALPPGEKVLRTRLGTRLADAIWNDGDGDRSAEIAERTLDDARALADPALLCVAMASACVIRVGRGDGPGARALRFEQVEVARRSGSPDLVAYALVGLAHMLQRSGEAREALKLEDEAERIGRVHGDPGLLARIQGSRAAVLWDTGDADGSLRAMEEAAALFQDIGDVASAARMQAFLGRHKTLTGDPAGGIEILKEAENELRRCGNSEGVAMVLADRASFHKHCGEYASALALLDEAIAITRAGALRRILANALSERGFVLRRIGSDQAEADACFTESLALYEALRDTAGILRVKNGRAHMLLAAGKSVEALAQYRETAALAREFGHIDVEASAMGNAAMALFDLGRVDEALADSIASERGFERLNNRIALSNTLQLRSQIHLSRGHVAEALEAATRGIALLDEPGLRAGTERLRALLIFLDAARKAGGQPETASFGREAHALAKAHGWLEKPPDAQTAAQLAALPRP